MKPRKGTDKQLALPIKCNPCPYADNCPFQRGESPYKIPRGDNGKPSVKKLGTAVLEKLGTAVLEKLGTAVLEKLGTAVLEKLGTAVLEKLGTAVLEKLGTAVLEKLLADGQDTQGR